ncbi:MAG: hypothetical protein AAFV19_24570 [Pseudomonadota bacterium]
MAAEPAVVMDEVLPEDAWSQLAATPGAVLIDVRAQEERSASGIPAVDQIDRNLWAIEWPKDTCNKSVSWFLADVVRKIKQTKSERLFFLSCSGGRARTAAQAVAAVTGDLGQRLHVTHIREGFEGLTQAHGRTSSADGWKGADLPWRPC